ncbi:uncharacterized protein METZ01_LOCUS511429, partial [marine metagenome]
QPHQTEFPKATPAIPRSQGVMVSLSN